MKLRWAGNREENRCLAFVTEKMDFGTVNALLLIWWLRFKALLVHTEDQSLGRKLKRVFLVRSFFNKAAIFNISLRFGLHHWTHVLPPKVPSTIHYLQNEEFVYQKVFRIPRFRIYTPKIMSQVLSLLNLILKYDVDCPVQAHTQVHNILSHTMLSKPFVMSWICTYRIAFSTKQVLISVSLRLQFKLLSKRTSSFSVLSVSPGGDVTIFPSLCGFQHSLHMRPFFFFLFVNVWKSLTLLRIPTLLKRKQTNCFYSSGSLAG